MQAFWLRADSYTVIKFRVKRSRQEVHFRVGADRAVRVFVVDQVGLVEFKTGRDFPAFAGHARTVSFDKRKTLQRGEYYLLISNRNESDVFVHYEM